MIVRLTGGRTARRSATFLLTVAMLATLMVGASASSVTAARPSCGGKVATIVGTNRAQVILGTPRSDVIVARGGNDLVYGGGGNDRICGGGGRDRLIGQAGDDRLFGDAGDDRLAGWAGKDWLDGGTGTDDCDQGPGRGGRVRCELVIGGPGSGQVGALLWAAVGPSGPGAWNTSSGLCHTGRINYGASGIEEYRFALEFPLSGLPAGSTIVRAVLSVGATTAAPVQSLSGYPGNGSISAADATLSGPVIGFGASTPGYQKVDVSSLVTPAMASAAWVGFLQSRADYQSSTWACRATDPEYPRLTIQYRVP